MRRAAAQRRPRRRAPTPRRAAATRTRRRPRAPRRDPPRARNGCDPRRVSLAPRDRRWSKGRAGAGRRGRRARGITSPLPAACGRHGGRIRRGAFRRAARRCGSVADPMSARARSKGATRRRLLLGALAALVVLLALVVAGGRWTLQQGRDAAFWADAIAAFEAADRAARPRPAASSSPAARASGSGARWPPTWRRCRC